MAGGAPEYMNVTPRVTGLDQFAKDVGKVAGIVDAANKDISKKGANFQPFKFDTAAVSRNLTSITSQFNKMWQGFDARSNFLTGFGNQITQFGRSIRYFAFDFERLGRSLTVGLTVPLVAAGTAVVKWGSEFEAALKKVEVLVDQNAGTVKRWGQEILTTMSGLGQSPIELAEGLFFAASAFGSMADKAPVMQVLEAAAVGATIGMGEMGDVTRLLTASVNAYASEGLGAAEAMNILIKTVTEGNFEAQKLATSLGRVLGSATALKIPFRDLATYIAGITRIGEDPSRIITSLNSALLKMLNPTDKAQKILEQYGYSLEDVKTALSQNGGLLDLLNEFRDVMSDQAFGQLFTNRAVRTALVATDALREEMKQINEYMSKEEKKRLSDIEKYQNMKLKGINEEYASAMLARLDVDKFYADQNRRILINSLDTVEGQFKILKDTIQSSAIGVFQGVVQAPLLDFLKQLNQQMVTFNQVIQQNPRTVALIVKIGAGLAALGPSIIILSRLAQAMTLVFSTTGLVATAVGRLGGFAVTALVRGFGLAGTTVLTLFRGMSLLLPLTTVLASKFVTLGAHVGVFAADLVLRLGTAIATTIGLVLNLAGAMSILTATKLSSIFAGAASAVLQTSLSMGSLLATLSPVVTLVATLGAAFIGVTGGLAIFLGAVGKVRSTVKPTFDKIGESINSLRKESGSWGEGLMAEYSNGIIRGAVRVVRALASIAKVIRTWLKPQSPPKILPEIDEWGKGTMEAWLVGWGKADFGILKDIMGDIGTYLKSVLDFGEDDNEDGIVAKMVIGSQKALMDAINQAKKTGTVAKEALQKIFDDLGTTTPALRGYIRSQLQVAAATSRLTAAQERLNNVTKQYEKLLKPLERRLSKINAIQEERDRKMREEELRYLLDTEIPDEIRAAAILELEEIGIERQISQLKQSQADAVAPLENEVAIAEEQLAAAQKQLEYFEGLMGLQENQANLLKDIADMLDETKDELKKLKEKLGEDLYGPGTPIEDSLIEPDLGALSGEGLGNIVGDLDKQLEGLYEEFDTMKEEWGLTWDAFVERWNTFKGTTIADIVQKFKDLKTNTIDPIIKSITEGADVAAPLWEQIVAAAQNAGFLPELPEGEPFDLSNYKNFMLPSASFALDLGTGDPVADIQNLVNFINEEALPGILSFVTGAGDVKKAIEEALSISPFEQLVIDFENIFNSVGEYIVGVGEQMALFGVTLYEGVKTKFGEAGAALKEFLGVSDETRGGFRINTVLMGVYGSNFQLAFEGVKLAVITAIDELKSKFQEWWDQLVEIYDYLTNTFNGGLEDIEGLIGDIKEEVGKLITKFGELLTAARDLVTEGLEKATTWFDNLLISFQNLGTYISDTFTSVFSSVTGTINSVIELIEGALSKLQQLVNLRNLLPGGNNGTSQDPTNPGNPGPEPAQEAFGIQAFAAEAAIGYNSSQYPVNTSPFRNMPSVGASGAIASTLGRTSANDNSVSVVVSPGGNAVLDGGVQIQFGDVHISNGMDMADFEARVENVIVRSIAR